MHDMRQISCPMCGRPVTISGSGPIPCPSCGVPVSAPAVAEAPVSPALADDDSATRVATIPPQPEPAPVEPSAADAPPAMVAAAAPVAETPVLTPAPTPVPEVSDTTDPRTQPVSEVEVRQAMEPPAAEPAPAATPIPAPVAAPVPASAGTPTVTPVAAPAPEQPVTQTYHGTPEPQQPVTQPYAPAMAPMPQPGQPAPKRNPALLIVGVVVAVVLLLGIAGAAVVFANRTGLQPAATPTATSTAAATTGGVPTGFVQFTDEGNVYTIDYPSGWTKTATGGDYSLTIFSGTPASIPGVFEVEYFKTRVDPKTLGEQFFKGLSTSGQVVNQQGPMTTSLAGESWQRETADVAATGGSQHVVVLTANHGQYSVVIAYLAAQTAFADADTHDFQPMLSSFQFLH